MTIKFKQTLETLEDDFLLNKDSFFDDWQEIHAKNVEFESALQRRIYFIINKIHEVFDCKISSIIDPEYLNLDSEVCYDCGRDKNGLRLFDLFFEVFTDSNIKLLCTDECNCKQFSILFEGKPLGIGQNFPKKWLFEDFEEELKRCKQDYIDWKISKEAERKANKVFNKLTKKKLQDALKSKLTPEELTLISFKK